MRAPDPRHPPGSAAHDFDRLTAAIHELVDLLIADAATNACWLLSLAYRSIRHARA